MHTTSSVRLADLRRLYEDDLFSSRAICRLGDPDVERLRGSAPPRWVVRLTRLELEPRPPRERALVNTLARELDADPFSSGVERTIGEEHIFDATAIDRIVCLGVGRYEHNTLRPFLGGDPRRHYADTLASDPAGVCLRVSRDHGLAFLAPDGRLRFRDFGTKLGGQRAGSKNGTWLNGERCLQNGVLEWRATDYLGIGALAWVTRGARLAQEHIFKLRCAPVLDA